MLGPKWKLYIFRKIDSAKRETAEDLLRRKLGLYMAKVITTRSPVRRKYSNE